MANNTDPSTTGIVHQRQREDVEVCRDVFGGTKRLREKRRVYLPQFPKELDAAYQRRAGSAVLFNAFHKTIKGLVAMVFRKSIVLGDDVPPEIRDHIENIDSAGRHLDVFARDLFEDAQIDGHAHILVDYPRMDPDKVQTLAEFREAGARPYWVAIRKQDVIRFRQAVVGGRVVLTQFAYIETTIEADGPFGEVEVQRVRQYDADPDTGVVTLSVWRKDSETDWTPEIEQEVITIGEIPVATVYTNRVAFMESEPPLLDLAFENIRHFQLRSDRDNALHVSHVPIFVTTGVDADDVGVFTVGATMGLALPGAEMSAYYVETTGSGLAQSRQELQDIEQRMAALGLAMLQRQSRAAETAEAKRLDKAEEDSQLGTAARSLEDAIEDALRLHAMWLEQESGGSVNVNRDFDTQPIDPGMVSVLLKAVGDGALSIETLWDILIRGEILPDNFDPEIERERLEESGLAELAAVAEVLRRQERESLDNDEQDKDAA